jgi:drug/metabolite transporter (DMT)-like permease
MIKGSICALLGAALFGLSAPLAKLLLGSISPQLLAGLLYLGAGIGLSIVRLFRKSSESQLQRKDLPLLAGIIVFGGVIGPLLLMLGLSRVSAVTGALLLNLEAPFTMTLAIFFGEHLGRRAVLAGVLIVGASLLLSLGPGNLDGEIIGSLCVAAACLSWGVDNNLTQRISLRDPIAIVQWKTLGAGLFAVPLALAMHARFPSAKLTSLALLLGLGSYGISIVLDVFALRLLGAAREAPLFATAPFVGALAAIPLLHERPRALDGAAALIMLGGVWLLLREKHGHAHTHEPIEHEHLHTHDDGHHGHTHQPMPEGPHSHPHRHERLTHDHPHTPDLHHRHKH